MFFKLFLLFAILPMVEIMLLLNVSDTIGGWNTFGLVVLTAFIGAHLVRSEGISTLNKVQSKLAQGTVPSKEMSEGILLLVAGVLMVTPGFITDLIGLLFTIPTTRGFFAQHLLGAFVAKGRFNVHGTGQPFGPSNHSAQDDVIDAEYHEKPSDSIDKPQDEDTKK